MNLTTVIENPLDPVFCVYVDASGRVSAPAQYSFAHSAGQCCIHYSPHHRQGAKQ